MWRSRSWGITQTPAATHATERNYYLEIIVTKILFCLLLGWGKSFKKALHTLPNSWSRDTESDGKSPITGALAGPLWAQICLVKDRCGTGKVIFNRAEWRQIRMIPGFSLFRFRFFLFLLVVVAVLLLSKPTQIRHVLTVIWITSNIWWDYKCQCCFCCRRYQNSLSYSISIWIVWMVALKSFFFFFSNPNASETPVKRPHTPHTTPPTHTHTENTQQAGDRPTPPIKGSTDGSKSITKNTCQSFRITTHGKWTLCMPQIWNYALKGRPQGAPTPDPLSRHVWGAKVPGAVQLSSSALHWASPSSTKKAQK